MAKIKAIGFDFDGTLIISEKDKAELFEEIFYKIYGLKKGVKRVYHNLSGKINRQEKIELLIQKLLNRKPTKQEIKEFSYAFSKGYEYRLSSCPLVLCTDILKGLKKQVKFMFLLSLENRNVVVDVAKHCGLAKYFHEILGGPKSKIDNFRHIINKHGIRPEEAVYIGDSKKDITLSKELNFKVIGIQKNFSYRSALKKLGADFTISNLCGIPLRHVTHGHMYQRKRYKKSL